MESIVQILQHDPKAQQFGDKSEFIKTVSQAAVRKTQAENSSAAQPSIPENPNARTLMAQLTLQHPIPLTAFHVKVLQHC